MNRQRLSQVKIRTVATWITLVLLGVVLYLCVNTFFVNQKLQSVVQSWDKFNAERSVRYRMLRQLNAILGYGGMIHNFSNYLIRGDIHYYRQALQAIATARFISSYYRNIADAEELEALQAIEDTMSQYSQALELIRLRMSNSEDPIRIAREIMVDDKAAVKGLELLQQKSLENSYLQGVNILKGSKLQLLNWIRSTMGYNGMIQHFKNYVILHDEWYAIETENKISYIFRLLGEYQALPISLQEQQAIERIRQVVNQYHLNLPKVEALIQKNAQVSEIDKVVIVDDQPALKAFSAITRAINLENEQEAKQVKSNLEQLSQTVNSGSLIIIVLIIISILSILWLLHVHIIHPVTRLTQVMQRLANNEVDVRIDWPDSQNEIGIMTRALQVFKQNALEKLRDAEMIKGIIRSAGEGIYGVNLKGELTFINPRGEQILGWKQQELLGKNLHDLCHYQKKDGSDYPLAECPTTRAIASATTIKSNDELFWRRDGSSFPVEMTVTPLYEKGKISGAVVLFQDISERVRIEQMKSEFISTVSHELRTPLTSIRGSLGLILGGALGKLDPKLESLLKIAGNNTERLLMLINDILDIEKIEAGSMKFDFQLLNLGDLVAQSLQEYRAYAEQYQVRFQLNHCEQDAMVYADSGRLMQVMANLLSNAAKFSKTGDVIEISVVRGKNNHIRVSVTDHGWGIPEAFQPRLFDKFTQSDASSTRKKGGTGLGLNIARAIVEKHNGILDFVSREGIGTTFYFDLPAQHHVEVADNQLKGTHLKQLERSAILIIEDDVDVAMMIKMILTQSGYNCDIAHNLQTAEKLLAQTPQKYVLITLDLQLEDGYGLDFLEQLRAREHSRDIPVTIISATADETRGSLQGSIIGVNRWLNKPFKEQHLTDILRDLPDVEHRKAQVLHVEDDDDIAALVHYLFDQCCLLTRVKTLADAHSQIQQQAFDLILLDIALPDGSGIDLIKVLKQLDAVPKIVIFTANDSVGGEYREHVDAVIIKSKTDNSGLYKVVQGILADEEKDAS